MNKNSVKGAAKTSAGTFQRAVGKLVGSRDQQAKGTAKRLEGRAQKRFGDLEEAIKTSRKARRR